MSGVDDDVPSVEAARRLGESRRDCAADVAAGESVASAASAASAAPSASSRIRCSRAVAGSAAPPAGGFLSVRSTERKLLAPLRRCSTTSTSPRSGTPSTTKPR